LSVQRWTWVQAASVERIWDRRAAVRMTAAVNSMTLISRGVGEPVLLTNVVS
jgi:hypothetical protein